MNCNYACKTVDHGVSRRAFLGGVGGMGLGALANPLAAKGLAIQQKRVLVVFSSWRS